MKLPLNLQAKLERELRDSVESVLPASGGCISQTATIRIVSGKQFFIKWNTSAPPNFFGKEARGLVELKKANALRIPEVICFRDRDTNTTCPFILLEFLKPGPQDEQSSQSLGVGLAKLHQYKSDKFGFVEDNFIGSLKQENPPSNTSWGQFFYKHRLLPQARLGKTNDWFNPNTEELLTNKRSKIEDTLNEADDDPSLLHGDLWTGNVFWSNQGPTLIDPAVYYGNREADVAFTELFGGFGNAFFEGYQSISPLTPGYPKRKAIHNLYHLMTHANLFGGHYVGSVQNVLEDI